MHAVRYLNTLHGFQATDANLHVVCELAESMDHSRLTMWIMARVAVSAANVDDFIGHNFLEIPTAERHLIGEVIQAICDGLRLSVVLDPPVSPIVGLTYRGSFAAAPALVKSHDFGGQQAVVTPEGHVFANFAYKPPHVRLQTRLKPKYTGGDVFSIDASETSYMDEHEAGPAILDRLTEWYHRTPALWKTARGKAFAQRLQAAPWHEDDEYDGGLLTKLAREDETECSAIDYPLGNPPAPLMLQPADDDDECMVCMDRRPDTLVLPCMHMVVCSTCSPLLAGTPDAATCLRCRRPIEGILVDEPRSGDKRKTL